MTQPGIDPPVFWPNDDLPPLLSHRCPNHPEWIQQQFIFVKTDPGSKPLSILLPPQSIKAKGNFLEKIRRSFLLSTFPTNLRRGSPMMQGYLLSNGCGCDHGPTQVILQHIKCYAMGGSFPPQKDQQSTSTYFCRCIRSCSGGAVRGFVVKGHIHSKCSGRTHESFRPFEQIFPCWVSAGYLMVERAVHALKQLLHYFPAILDHVQNDLNH